MTKLVRVLSETAVTRRPIKWVLMYSHPLDECPAGSTEWEVTVREFAPGLMDYAHPKCSYCGCEPRIESFFKEPDTGMVPWVETKAKLAEIRAQRETEPVYDSGRFDNA